MKKSGKRKARRAGGWKAALFLAALLLLSAVMLLRWKQAESAPPAPAVPTPPAPAAAEATPEEKAPEQTAPAEPAAEKAEETERPVAEPAAQPPDAAETAGPGTETTGTASSAPPSGAYTETTYQIVTDLVYTRRHLGEEGEKEIQRLLQTLDEEDPALGKLWRGIMDYWAYVSSDLTVNTGALPENLPADESLCIVVLGFQLLPDGSMAEELLGRCETALACAEQYPNALLALTGGGTAYGNRQATEAGVMADWFVSRGISRDRILVEDRSLTTDQNAAFTCELLAERDPAVRELVIVSSDYHVALGSMLFTEASLLYAYRNACEPPFRVAANAGFPTSGSPEYSDPRRYGSDIWILADPTY